MKRNNKTPSKNLAFEGRSGKSNNLIKGGKRWSIEKKIEGHHITHFDSEKGFNVDSTKVFCT
jgi:hypothetical protein